MVVVVVEVVIEVLIIVVVVIVVVVVVVVIVGTCGFGRGHTGKYPGSYDCTCDKRLFVILVHCKKAIMNQVNIYCHIAVS